ncbi:MAG TPA: DUF4097 family beta strand repeat-containing protein [Blastocatellia bacterium]|nr:DUF4097 family beta strand repeat-containing protein [Blastocatellia bacterium]
MHRRCVIRRLFKLPLAAALASTLFIGSGAVSASDPATAPSTGMSGGVNGGGPVVTGTATSDPAAPKVTRTYPAPEPIHITLTNGRGPIDISGWDRREVSLRADCIHPVLLDERRSGNDLDIQVRRNRIEGMERVGIAINAPRDTSISIRSTMGEIYITGLTGHVKVDGVDGDIHLAAIKSPSIDVKVIRGDIYFDGELSGAGPFSMQSMAGDIDVTLPDGAAFDLHARALTDNINVGGFFLSPRSQEPKSVTGKHEGGGPRLSLTTYDGRIFMHKK